METTIRKKRIANDILDVEFTPDFTSRMECVGNSPTKVLHTTAMHKIRPGVLVKQVAVSYSVDTAGIRLCPDISASTCSTNGETVMFNVPSLPQPYWRGDTKRLQIRACASSGFSGVDFNVAVVVEAEVEERDNPSRQVRLSVIESSMYVKVR